MKHYYLKLHPRHDLIPYNYIEILLKVIESVDNKYLKGIYIREFIHL